MDKENNTRDDNVVRLCIEKQRQNESLPHAKS